MAHLCNVGELVSMPRVAKSKAVERVARDVCAHTCSTCEHVDLAETARSAGIDTRKDLRYAGMPLITCEMLANDTNRGNQERGASCFALRRCRANSLPAAVDYGRSIDDAETVSHMLAHCLHSNQTSASVACCAGSPYPGVGGDSPRPLRRPPPPPPPPPPPRPPRPPPFPLDLERRESVA